MNQNVNSLQSIIFSFLHGNPGLINAVISMMETCIQGLKAISSSPQPSEKLKAIANKGMGIYGFKEKVVSITLTKVGYNISDIEELLAQGRGEEVLKEIDKLQRVLSNSAVTSSRRKKPSITPQIEEIE